MRVSRIITGSLRCADGRTALEAIWASAYATRVLLALTADRRSPRELPPQRRLGLRPRLHGIGPGGPPRDDETRVGLVVPPDHPWLARREGVRILARGLPRRRDRRA